MGYFSAISDESSKTGADLGYIESVPDFDLILYVCQRIAGF